MTEFLNLTKEDGGFWHTLHKNKFLLLLDVEDEEEEKKTIISVTSLIQYLGWGYEARGRFFLPKKEEQEENSYLSLCLAHGEKMESRALEMFLVSGDYELHPFSSLGIENLCGKRDILLGTPDAFIIDKRTGEVGILEIKCPFGNSYGRNLNALENFEESKGQSRWKHWLQVQLYLWIFAPYLSGHLTRFAILAYYYHHAGPNGEPVLNLTRFSSNSSGNGYWSDIRERDLYLHLREFEKLAKSHFTGTLLPRGKVWPIKLKEDILRGITQRELLLEEERYTKVSRFCAQELYPLEK
jgi:hypothetical protein